MDSQNTSRAEATSSSIVHIIFYKAVSNGVVPIGFKTDNSAKVMADFWNPTEWWKHPHLISVRFSDGSVVTIDKNMRKPAEDVRYDAESEKNDQRLAEEMAKKLSDMTGITGGPRLKD